LETWKLGTNFGLETCEVIPKERNDLAVLRRKVQSLEVQGRQQWKEESKISTGVEALDQMLPDAGLARGTLVEWFMGSTCNTIGWGSGAGILAMRAACEAAREGGYVMVFDRQRRFFPPAAAAWGLDLGQLVVVRPTSLRDELWALDQALRCQAIAAVWGYWEQVDWRWFRRLQLSAEQGGALGLLLRPGHLRGEPSWSDVQWYVEPQKPGSQKPGSQKPGSQKPGSQKPGSQKNEPSRSQAHSRWQLAVTLTRCRGGSVGKTAQIELQRPTG
jgi:protein ImuA